MMPTLLFVGFAATSLMSGTAQVSSLIDKTVAAYGGQKALAKAKQLRQLGKVASTMRGGAEGKLVRIFAYPQRLRVEVTYPQETAEVRVLDTNKGWRGGRPVSGPPLDAMMLQAARLALPMLLVDKKAVLKDAGQIEKDGKKLRVLEVPLERGMTMTVFIDPANGHIVRTVGKADVKEMGGTIEFATDYADFRKVDGVLFAFKEATFAMGQHTGNTTLEKVELGSNPKNAFAP